MADLLGSILSSMEKPPSLGDQESRRKARGEDPKLTAAHLSPAPGTTLPPLWTMPPPALEDPSQATFETPGVLKRPAGPPALLHRH